MKFIVSLTAVLASSMAFAFPQVGDRSEMAGTVTQGSQSMPITLILEMVKMDPATGAFTQRTTQNVGGQAQTQEDVVSKQDVFTPAMAADILQNCANYGGSRESVTVKAGTFSTCAMPNQTQDGGMTTAWVANVPFGVVKYSETGSDGTFVELELQMYK